MYIIIQHFLSGISSLEMIPLMSNVLLQITPSDYKRMQLQHCQKSVLPVLFIVQATIYEIFEIPYIWLNLSIQIPAQLLLSWSDIISY